MKKIKTHELQKRFLFTILILAIYVVGRNLLLYDIDNSAYKFVEINSQNLMAALINGEKYRYTIFALGIMPIMISGLLVQICLALISSESRERFSPNKIKKITMLVLISLSILSAIDHSEQLIFKESYFDFEILRVISVIEMVTGVLFIYWMTNLNKDHGIGGQSIIIIVNAIDRLISTLQSYTYEELQGVLGICVLMVLVTLVMENRVIRIPVQRVSIHNDYADKNYIGFKLNPIGVMPVMFAMAFFMLIQLITRCLIYVFEDYEGLSMFYENLTLTTEVGVWVYLSIIFLQTVVFSFLMLSPGDIAEQLQKGGDSIVGVYAGKKTRWYLRRKLFLLSAFSGTVLCLLMGISLWLALSGEIPSAVALYPSTVMLLTGLICNLYQEISIYRKFDLYNFFM